MIKLLIIIFRQEMISIPHNIDIKDAHTHTHEYTLSLVCVVFLILYKTVISNLLLDVREREREKGKEHFFKVSLDKIK